MIMREKIALAIANADDNAHVVLGRGAFTNAEWKKFEQIADAVLNVLMDPTEEMCLSTGDGPNTSRRVFTSMIRFAKERNR